MSEETTKAESPDCATCTWAPACERAREGTFCVAWRSAKPPEREPDPSEAWRRGEEVPW